MEKKKQLFPFWKDLCPEPSDDNELDMCRFMCAMTNYIKKHIRKRIKEDGYPKTQESVLEYIHTASSCAMAEMIMIGLMSK